MTANDARIGSNLDKVDAYENNAADYDEVPELSDEFFARGEVRRMGRPPIGERSKKQVTLRLDQEVIDHYRGTGAGWQSRINEALRKTLPI